MSTHDHLPEGRLKRFEQWISRNETKLLRCLVVLMFVTSVTTAALGFKAQKDRDDDFKTFLTESAVRRDQACTADERRDRDEIDQLRRTYEALVSPTTRAQLGPGLVRVIVAQMPETEKHARTADAPDYCKQKGIGLPFNRKLDTPPKRRDFSFLLAPSNSPP